MTEISVLTVFIESRSCMEALGAIIGKNLLDPRLYPKEDTIACAYGVKNGGKSTLLTESGVAILSKAQGSYRSENDVKVIHTDFAFYGTYPNEIHRDISGSCSMRDMINKDKKEPAAHLFEHSPVNVLAKGDVGIVISWPAQPEDAYGRKPRMNHFYLTAMADNLEFSARKTGLEDGAVAKVVDQMREASKDLCDDPANRIVRLFPLSDAPLIEDALEKTRKKVTNAPHLFLIDPELSSSLTCIKKRAFQIA